MADCCVYGNESPCFIKAENLSEWILASQERLCSME
jgi:hypothetical protein